jgi:hypothetical protein
MTDSQSVSQSVCLSWCQASIWDTRPNFYYCQTVEGFMMWGSLSDERMGLSFTIAAGPHQCGHSRIRIPLDSWPYYTVSGSRPPTWRARPLYSYPQGTGWPGYNPCLLRLAGVWWRYLNPSPHRSD